MSAPFICHIEWGTPDPAVLENFLTQLFSWQFQAFAHDNVIYDSAGGGASVGIIHSEQMRVGGLPNASRRVTDMESMLAKAEELGAKIVVPKTPIGDGSFAFIAAPDGSLIGLQNL
jgi:predicted enzyme related to lactoylglutathione lyase